MSKDALTIRRVKEISRQFGDALNDTFIAHCDALAKSLRGENRPGA